MRRKQKKPIQLVLAAPQSRTWGGRRVGAGRPKLAQRPGTPHDARPAHKARFPLHVTLKARRNWLRNHAALEIVTRSLENLRKAHEDDVRVVHFSLQRDHLHLIVEASNEQLLGCRMQGLASIIARRINRAQGQEGALWVERYHARELKTPLEVRNAIRYVLLNATKHGEKSNGADFYSSARWFDGWSKTKRARPNLQEPYVPSPTACARTWLITVGWRRCGLISSRDQLEA